jgi:hypothetical protein
LKEDTVLNTQDIKNIFAELAKLKEASKKFCTIDDHNLLKARVDQLEAMCAALRKTMSDLEKKMKNQKAGGGAVGGGTGGGADQGAIDSLMDELNRLR